MSLVQLSTTWEHAGREKTVIRSEELTFKTVEWTVRNVGGSQDSVLLWIPGPSSQVEQEVGKKGFGIVNEIKGGQ